MGEGSPPTAVMNPLEIELLLCGVYRLPNIRSHCAGNLACARPVRDNFYIALQQPTSRGYNTTLHRASSIDLVSTL